MNTTARKFLEVEDSNLLHRDRTSRIPPGQFRGGDELPPGTYHKPNAWVDDRTDVNEPLARTPHRLASSSGPSFQPLAAPESGPLLPPLNQD